MKGNFCPMSRKAFIVTNVIIGVIAVNIFILTRLLETPPAFSYGLYTGLAAGWLLYFFRGLKEFKKPSYENDERIQMIIQKASSMAFWVVVSLMALFVIVCSSPKVSMTFDPREWGLLAMNSMLALYGIFFLILNRRL
jgi:uncharacterized membrane protein